MFLYNIDGTAFAFCSPVESDVFDYCYIPTQNAGDHKTSNTQKTKTSKPKARRSKNASTRVVMNAMPAQCSKNIEKRADKGFYSMPHRSKRGAQKPRLQKNKRESIRYMMQ